MFTQEALSAPIVMFYTEGKETFSVNAAALIGRPAIGMKPSGGWRLTGIGTAHGRIVHNFPAMIRALIAGESFPNRSACALTDWDHGTHRQHGSPSLSRVWIAADSGLHADELLALVDRFDLERRAAEIAKAEAENAARFAAAKAQPEVYSDSRYGVALHRFKRRPDGFNDSGPAFAVSWADGATAPLPYGAARRELGEALTEAAEGAES